MKENELGNLFLRHLVIAVPWGIIFLITMFIVSIGVKQQIKEGVQYAIRTGIQESESFVYNYQVVVPVKKNVKEGVEFLAKTARNEIKALLQDPQVKQDLKEAFEYGGKQLR